jgi:L-seryl-tRNA(Ser) seleniumtransferase
MHRRTWLKWLAAAPVYGVIATRAATESLAAATGATASGEVYRRLGVRPFINARGTWTVLERFAGTARGEPRDGGSGPALRRHLRTAEAAGRKLAQLSGAESGMVTSGAAGAMAAATAGCMAGTDPNKVWQLPDTTGMKNEVVMLGGRSAFDSAIRLAGAKLVVVGSVDDLAGAPHRSHRDGVHDVARRPAEAALAVTKKAGVPLLLDDAAGIPPIENLKTYAQMGIDLFCFSGGKGCAGRNVRAFSSEERI